MSNEFEVYDFYDMNVAQLKETREEFISLCDSAIAYHQGKEDLNGKLTKEEWFIKHDGEDRKCDDDLLFERAEEFFKSVVYKYCEACETTTAAESDTDYDCLICGWSHTLTYREQKLKRYGKIHE